MQSLREELRPGLQMKVLRRWAMLCRTLLTCSCCIVDAAVDPHRSHLRSMRALPFHHPKGNCGFKIFMLKDTAFSVFCTYILNSHYSRKFSYMIFTNLGIIRIFHTLGVWKNAREEHAHKQSDFPLQLLPWTVTKRIPNMQKEWTLHMWG